MTPPADPGSAPLARFEAIGLWLMGLLLIAFGGLVADRSAFQTDRKTDFGVYARAGFSVRATLTARYFPSAVPENEEYFPPEARELKYDIYQVCDDRGWHYCYPPAFAVFMVPLADPFFWEDRTGYLPFGASVIIWFVINLILAWYAAHALAGAVVPDAVRWSRRWWYARTVPLYICLGGIGYTLSRGQVNIVLVALVAGMFAAAVRGRAVAAGAWLAGAVALKVIPVFLILFPLVRREWRTGIGLAAGLFVLLGVIPAAVWGVEGAVDNNLKVFSAVIAPGSLGVGDQTRQKELTGATSTDSQSFQAVIHNLRYPDKPNRPKVVDKSTRLAHWALSLLMVAVTLVAAWRGLGPAPADQLVFLGLLCVVMLLTTPVSHMHYYAMGLPLVAGLWLKGLAGRPGEFWAGWCTFGVLMTWGVLTALPLFPPVMDLGLLDAGLATFSTVALWAYGVAVMGRCPRTCPVTRPAARLQPVAAVVA
ncbi:glycosyltransferase family 87 protein [Fimbriiglobus ruber]|uniref:Uncharacterized protein n=1 Tax=Fimbriiglobus ruber TaxID=1908690 RepID=A0A225DUW1_9BACT|nr:glycosyltransferase family 87 protein [Fimbriiglobus ruber]OWK43434.1 hypothetical protein FRUB_03033 [Fimbriiglobus ruber]